MRLNRIKISNILGIEELEFEAGQFTAFTGHNEAGKTSALQAVKAVLGRDGDDATLLRKGAEVGEIVAVFDDETVVRKTVTPTGSRTSISGGPDGKVTATSTMLKSLTDSMSVNPVDFIRSGDTPADKRQRLQWLLECLPVEIDQARLEEIAGPAIKAADPKWRAFDQLEAIRKEIFQDRTATNRAAEEKRGSVNQLAQTLPEDEEGAAVTGDPDSLQADLDRMDRDLNAALQEVSEKLSGYERESAQRVTDIREKFAGRKQAKRDAMAALQAEIAALETEEAAEVAAERAWMTETSGKAEGKRSELRLAHSENRAPIASTLAAIRAGANALAKAAATRSHIKKFEDDIRDLEEDAQRMTKRLAQLQDYKSELLSNIPIDGLTVDDGEIYRHGVPFDRLNTAQQIDMAVEIAKLRAGRAGIICVDGIENLDSSQYHLFREKSVASGLQLFVTRVTDGNLAVETA